MTVTNAAGGLNSDYSVGDLVLLNDARNPCLSYRGELLTLVYSICSWRDWQEPTH